MSGNGSEVPYVTSFWAPASIQRSPGLDGKSTVADIAIVGGGFAGLSCAYYLRKARPDLNIVLLEAEHVGFGPSGRNFGGIATGVREIRAQLLGSLDMEEEKFVTAWYLRGRDELERRIAEGGIDCEYRNEPVLMQALDDPAWEGLQREAEFLAQKGTPHELFDAAALRKVLPVPYPTKGGLVRTAWRSVQPFKLVRGFADQARRLGVCIYEGTRLSEVTSSGSEVTIKTADGGTLRAQKAIIATGAYSELLKPFTGLVFPRHTWVVATEPLETGMLESIGFKDYKFVEDSGYVFYYARVYQQRLLFGGGMPTNGFMTSSTLDTAADRSVVEYARLRAEMIQRWPQLRDVRIERAWGGPIDVTSNYAPIVKEMPGIPNVILCIGFNGEGMVSGSLIGKLLLGVALGPKYEDKDAERVRQYLLGSSTS
jgi:gamma-glutamylputrescine oxidase